MKNNFNYNFIFSDFFAIKTLELNLQSIEQYSYDLKNKNSGRILSNINGWQSHELDKNQTERDLFCNVFQEELLEVASGIGIRKRLELTNSWININSVGSFNQRHIHGASLISGIFYVKAPKNSGNLVFANLNGHAISSYYKQFSNENYYDYNQISSETWSITPEENMLILFPSWLPHYVDVNRSNDINPDRISISFNSVPIFN